MRYMAALAVLFLTSAAAVPAATVPRPMDDFKYFLPGGKPINLASYKGKVIVVEFLYTTCPHCQHASQMLTKLGTELGAKGFQPLGIAFNDANDQLVSDFSRDYKVGYPVGYAGRQAVMEYLQLSVMDRFVVPQIVLIDKKGVIRAQSPPTGDEKLQDETSLRTQIEALLKEPGAVTTTKRPATSASAVVRKH